MAATTIVYNACYGGFSLSAEAMKRYHELKHTTWDGRSNGRNIPRTDPDLARVVRELGTLMASGRHAELRIRELEPGTQYFIDETDGAECVKTIANIKWNVA